MPYFTIAIVVMSAVFFHRAAEFENESTVLWPGLSLLVSAATLFCFHWGWWGILPGQAGLLLGIAVFRLLRKT